MGAPGGPRGRSHPGRLRDDARGPPDRVRRSGDRGPRAAPRDRVPDHRRRPGAGAAGPRGLRGGGPRRRLRPVPGPRLGPGARRRRNGGRRDPRTAPGRQRSRAARPGRGDGRPRRPSGARRRRQRRGDPARAAGGGGGRGSPSGRADRAGLRLPGPSRPDRRCGRAGRRAGGARPRRRVAGADRRRGAVGGGGRPTGRAHRTGGRSGPPAHGPPLQRALARRPLRPRRRSHPPRVGLQIAGPGPPRRAGAEPDRHLHRRRRPPARQPACRVRLRSGDRAGGAGARAGHAAPDRGDRGLRRRSAPDDRAPRPRRGTGGCGGADHAGDATGPRALASGRCRAGAPRRIIAGQ